jgi:hypothetical protein
MSRVKCILPIVLEKLLKTIGGKHEIFSTGPAAQSDNVLSITPLSPAEIGENGMIDKTLFVRLYNTELHWGVDNQMPECV